MPRRLRVFVSSPGDLPDERLRADLVVDKLAQDFRRFFTLETYRWEHEPMLASGHFQDAIDPPSTFDIVILIVWSRLGTLLPEKTGIREYRGIDGRTPVTGTEWEYEDALQAARTHGTPDILAFRNVSPAAIDTRDADARSKSLAQLDALDIFWKRHFADRGVFLAAYDEYQSLDDFARRLEESLHKLIERRIKASATGSDTAAIWRGAPFRGLEAYEFEHSAIFFGRDGLVAKAAEQLSAHARSGTAFLLVSGASGSGKSSLVKAALVPRLMKPQRIQGTAFLRRAVYRPGDGGGDVILGLIDNLTRGPADNGIGLPELLAPGQKIADLAGFLRSTAQSPGFVFSSALARVTDKGRSAGHVLAFEEAKLVLVIDQIEELFSREGIAPEDRSLFIRLLAGLAGCGAVWVIVTIRADFWHRAAEFPELMALAEGTGRIDIAAPAPAELAEMIRKPAQAAGLEFETHPQTGIGLDAVLAEHAAAEPGVLPLLSFTLDALYAQDIVARGGRSLTYATYEGLGGLEGAIATRADEVVAALPEAAQAAVPRVLRALTTVSEASAQAPVARAAPLSSFPEGTVARAVVDALTAARLLVASSEAAAPTVRLAHEALISRWTRAKEQLAAERRDLETRALIERQQLRWAGATGRAKQQLLLHDPDLANAVDLRERWNDELPAELQAFIGLSNAAARSAARRRWVVAIVVMLCLAALTAASFGALTIAEIRRDDALIAQSRSLARDARTAIAKGDPTLGMLLALAALPKNIRHPDRPFLKDAEYPLANGFANRREKFALRGHEDFLGAVAFSLDGSRVVTASDDRTARIWDAHTGASVAVLTGHAGRVNSAAFSRDGTKVVTASDDDTARVWNASTGQAVTVYRKHAGPVTSAAFSPDGTNVVTASWDATAQIWDAGSGATRAELRGHKGHVLSAVFSPDGARVVTASEDGSARLWDARTGAPGPALNGHEDRVSSAAFSADGTRIVTASDDKTARVWDSTTGTVIAILSGHAAEVNSAVFSPDGSLVVTASDDNSSRLWDAKTGTALKVLPGHEGPVYSAGFSPDGTRVVTASDDKTARLWDVDTGATVAVLGGHEGFVFSAAFSPDGTQLVTGSHERVARIWDTESSAALAVLRGHRGEVKSAMFSPDGTRALTASADDTARLWSADDGTAIAVLTAHKGAVNSAVYSADGTRIVTASADHTARIWDGKTGAPLQVLAGHSDDVRSAAFSPDGAQVVTASADHTARLWSAATGAPALSLSGHAGAVNSASFSSDGTRIVTASSDHTGRLWDAKTGTLIAELKGHENYVGSAAFSLDGSRIVTASGDNTARVWDGKTGAAIAVLRGHTNTVTSAAFSPDARRVVTASVDHTARVWDVASGRPVVMLEGHDNTVWSAMFSPDGTRLVTAAEDKTSRLWDAETGALVAVLGGHQNTVRFAAFSPGGTKILTAGSDRTARLWRMPPRCQELIDTARAQLPRQLSASERARYFLEDRQPAGLARLYDAARPLLALVLPAAGDTCD